ncbi:hypothetical protein JI58_07245 [Marinosulfonomonas sp. PRT-SC04]|nr:hypothetical protein JI58_07245 [Marinosulfonomonas sp. PRT-SC04]
MKYPLWASLRRITLLLLAISSLGIAQPLSAHEFWLQPQDFQPKTGDTLQVQLRNGQQFKGIEIGYFDKRIERFEWFQNQTSAAVISRAGDFPAMRMTAKQDGLMVLAYVSTFSIVQYYALAKFLKFAAHKDFPKAEAEHRFRNLPKGRFNEAFTRYCKTLIGVGSAVGQDLQTNMETEFVALSNPYTDDLSQGFTVRLLYRGSPRAHAQIEVFARDPGGKVTISLQHTDAQGHAVIAVKPAHQYLLDALILREPDGTLAAENHVVWETLWASMTFYTPK